MKRIDTATAETDTHGSGKDGFTNGDPGVTLPTAVDADWFNGVQEEIVRTIEGAGLTPDGGDLGQLLEAVQALIAQNPAYANYGVSGSAITQNNKFTLGAAGANTGFSLSSNEITMPTAGLYQVTFATRLEWSAISDPGDMVVGLKHGASISTFRATRFSADPSDPVMVQGVLLFEIEFDSESVALRSSTTGELTVNTAGFDSPMNRLQIVRLRNDGPFG